MQYISCINTLYFESLITLIAITVLVSNIRPSGIIAISAATVFTVAFCIVFDGILICFIKKIIPIGTIMYEINFIIAFNDFIISDPIGFKYLAFFVILYV